MEVVATLVGVIIGIVSSYFLLREELNENRENVKLQIKANRDDIQKQFEENRRVMKLQFEENQKIIEAQLWIQMDSYLQRPEFVEVHQALRNGDWRDAKDANDIPWPEVDGYMGFFERVYFFMQNGILNRERVKQVYGYRIENILSVPLIVEHKLIGESSDWKNFIQLCKELEIDIPST